MTPRAAYFIIAGIFIITMSAIPWARTERPPQHPERYARAVFAGGCFWCMEPAFEKITGVVYVRAGYSGGTTKNPTYDEVSVGGSGHREAVEVFYDPAQVSYAQLLDVFWHNVDPENPDGQFCDFGEQYRSAIFYMDDAQRQAAVASETELQRTRRWVRMATDILPALPFYPAETYHQDYARKNPLRYRFYRRACGRDNRLAVVWDDRRLIRKSP